jgi:flagellar export protein FliJ
MKPFKFTLQPLLTLRLRQERAAMENYAREVLERARVEERLQAAERALAASQLVWRQDLADGCPAVVLVHHQSHCRDLAGKRAEIAKQLVAADQRANAALEAMLQARLQREAVDKFRSRQRVEYDRALTRAEQKFLDDLAQSRAGGINRDTVNHEVLAL